MEDTQFADCSHENGIVQLAECLGDVQQHISITKQETIARLGPTSLHQVQ